MPDEITEERLADFERHGQSESVAPSEVLALVAEVRRLRKILDGEDHKPGAFDRMTDWAQQMETERDDARSLLKQAVKVMEANLPPLAGEFVRVAKNLFVKWADEEQAQRRMR